MNDSKNKSIPGDLLTSKETCCQILQNISGKILSSVEDRAHQFENYQYSSFRYYILLLQQRYQDDPERQCASLLLAWLLNRSLRSDFYMRNVYAHGDVFPESATNLELNETQYDRFLTDLGRYVKQSSEAPGNPDDAAANWGIYFFTEYLMTELFYQQGSAILANPDAFREWFPQAPESDPGNLPKERKIELLEDFNMDCGGLFPLIDDDSSEIRSWMPLINTPKYCFAFLYIPRNVATDFRSNIPGYLHEICHYIPPVSRRSRNEAATLLLACAITNDWRNELYRKLDSAGLAQEHSRELCRFYIENTRRLVQNEIRELACRESVVSEDSLTLCDYTVCSLLDLEDDFFEKEIFGVNPDLSEFDNAARETVLSALDRQRKEFRDSRETGKFQREHAVRFAVTYNYLLRELRSDIFMTVLLEIDTAEYFRLMADEPRFAYGDTSFIGDYQVFRFGLMTRLLWQMKKAGGADFQFRELDSEKKFNEWQENFRDILNKLENSYDTADERRKHVQNLREYLAKYVKLAVETESGFYTPPYHSLLESELSSEINKWYECANRIKDCESIRKLRDLYRSGSSAGSIYEDMTQTAIAETAKWNVSWPLAPDEYRK